MFHFGISATKLRHTVGKKLSKTDKKPCCGLSAAGNRRLDKDQRVSMTSSECSSFIVQHISMNSLKSVNCLLFILSESARWVTAAPPELSISSVSKNELFPATRTRTAFDSMIPFGCTIMYLSNVVFSVGF